MQVFQYIMIDARTCVDNVSHNLYDLVQPSTETDNYNEIQN